MINAILKIMPGYYENNDAINKTINYLYRVNKKPANPLPVFCYGTADYTYPLSPETIIQNFHQTRQYQNQSFLSDRQVWHFSISFSLPACEITRELYFFADAIAKLFSKEYQICYAYHGDTDNPHFQYIVSAASYIPDYPALDEEKMRLYETQMTSTANNYDIFLERKE